MKKDNTQNNAKDIMLEVTTLLQKENELEKLLEDYVDNKEATLNVIKQIEDCEKRILENLKSTMWDKAWETNNKYMIKEFGKDNAFFEHVRKNKGELKLFPDDNADDRYCVNFGIYNLFREFLITCAEYNDNEIESERYLNELKEKYIH